MTEKDRCCLACGRIVERDDKSFCPYCGEAFSKGKKSESESGHKYAGMPMRALMKMAGATPLSIKWKYARRRIWRDRFLILVCSAIVAGVVYAYFSGILPTYYAFAAIFGGVITGVVGLFVTIDYVWAAHDMMNVEIEMAGREER